MRRRLVISLSAATGLLEAIEAAGANPEQVVRAVGLTHAAISKPDGFIPCAQFARLLDERPAPPATTASGSTSASDSTPRTLARSRT